MFGASLPLHASESNFLDKKDAVNFALFGPGIWPCNEFERARKSNDRENEKMFLMWTLGYERTLEEHYGVKNLNERFLLEDQFNWLDRHCHKLPSKPFRCAVDSMLRVTFPEMAKLLQPEEACLKVVNEALKQLEEEAKKQSVDRQKF